MNRDVALVTGGSKGIGLGIARQLARQGLDIAFNGVRREEEVQGVLEDIQSMGVHAIYCRGNVAVAEERRDILDKIQSRFGKLNILVNNAGIAPKIRQDILSTTEESFDEVMNINLKGAYFLTQAAANWMIEEKKTNGQFAGCIINVSSVSASVASVNRGEYCISKAGVSMATQLFAVRLAEFDIPVYEVRPGIIATDMTSGVKSKYDALIGQGLCLQRRWGVAEDVGKCVGALVAGSFPYSTGHVFTIDGGLTIPRM